MKYLSIKLIKYAQDLHDENYKMLMKEIKEELNNWKEPLLQHGRFNIVKMSILS